MNLTKASKYYFVIDKFYKECLERFSADLGSEVKNALENATEDTYGQYIKPRYACIVDNEGNIVSTEDGEPISVDFFLSNGADLCEYYTRDDARFIKNAILRYFNVNATDLGKRFDTFKKMLQFTGDSGKRTENIAKVTQTNTYGKLTVTDKPRAVQNTGVVDDTGGYRDGTHSTNKYDGDNSTETEREQDTISTERTAPNVYETESTTAGGLTFAEQYGNNNPVSKFINGFMSLFCYIPDMY